MGLIFHNSVFFIFLPLIIINQFVLTHLPAVAATDVLSPGDELNSPNSTLTSAMGIFTLGFFTIKSTNLTYLGIWYTNDDARKVWVANRDVPINSSSTGVLMIDETGTLKVVIKGGNANTTNTRAVFNVSNQVGVGSGINTTRAVLEDTGNFKLYDVANGNQTLWESFDYPTDTLLPGMKLGNNFRTGQNWTLTSWLSEKIPASGDFTLKCEIILSSPQLVIYRREKLYWTSGPLEYDLSYRPGATFLFGLGVTFVSDASGSYIANLTDQLGNVVPWLQLSSMGQIIEENFIPMQYEFCSPSDKTSDELLPNIAGGCANNSAAGLSNCNNGYMSTMLSKGYMSTAVSQNGYMLTGLMRDDNSSNISLSDCMQTCWNDCKCRGFSSSNINGTGCRIWDGYSEINGTWDGFSSDDRHMNVGILYSYKPLKTRTWIEKNWKFIIPAVVVLLICVYIVYRSAPWLYVRIRKRILAAKEKRRRDNYIHQLTGSYSFNYGDVLEKGIKDAPDIKVFSLGAILTATDSFSIENKLGQGGYGPVYKGKLHDGREIAIKRLSKTSGQGIDEFKSELILISKLQHTNLVRLYGCCIHQEEKMLIYEFMPNKSLDFFLFAEDKKATLHWRMRFNIIEGVAQGLLYLHKYSRMRIIHRDLKVSNVLLDENMNSKIADFGMARSFQPNVTEAITNKIVGTYGYMAPEYAMEGTFSIKSDVFSFGVLILEIVSGIRNSRFHNLVKYAWELWKGDAMLELKDEAVGESFDLKQLLSTIHVGLLCVQDNADDRPTMLEVISMLNNEVADLPNPKQPLFATTKQPLEDSSSKNISVSINGLSITAMEAR